MSSRLATVAGSRPQTLMVMPQTTSISMPKIVVPTGTGAVGFLPGRSARN
jgi:hypothetical protein